MVRWWLVVGLPEHWGVAFEDSNTRSLMVSVLLDEESGKVI